MIVTEMGLLVKAFSFFGVVRIFFPKCLGQEESGQEDQGDNQWGRDFL